VALLIALFLPALNKARETARRAVCLSQLRQHYISMSTYATDSKDMPPTTPVVMPDPMDPGGAGIPVKAKMMNRSGYVEAWGNVAPQPTPPIVPFGWQVMLEGAYLQSRVAPHTLNGKDVTSWKGYPIPGKSLECPSKHTPLRTWGHKANFAWTGFFNKKSDEHGYITSYAYRYNHHHEMAKHETRLAHGSNLDYGRLGTLARHRVLFGDDPTGGVDTTGNSQLEWEVGDYQDWPHKEGGNVINASGAGFFVRNGFQGNAKFSWPSTDHRFHWNFVDGLAK